MKLHNRVLLLLGATLLCLVVGVSLLSSRLLLRSYIRLEQQRAVRNLERVGGAFQQLVDALHEKSFDWANWDDSYRFMADHNRAYIASNLTDAGLQGMRLDAILYVDVHGHLFHTKTIHRFPKLSPPLPTEILAALPSHVFAGPLHDLSGVAHLPEGPLLVTVRPIRNSNNQGTPRGWLVFGYYFTPEEAAKLGARTRLNVQFLPLDAPDLPAEYRKIAVGFTPAKPYRITPGSEQVLTNYTSLADVQGHPLLFVRIHESRDIYQQGLISVQKLLRLIILASLVFSGVAVLIIDRYVLRRLASISRQVGGIHDLGSALPRIALPGKDELTALAGKINTMLEALEENATRLRLSEEQLRAYNTGLEQAVAARTQELQQANAVLENALDGIAHLDAEGHYLSVNAAYASLFGCAPEALLGTHWASGVHPGDMKLVQEAFQAMPQQGKAEIEARGIRQEDFFCFQMVLLPSCNADGTPDGSYCFLKDITERKRLEDQIAYQAFHDLVTDLPNRALFMQALARAQAGAQQKQTLSALLFFDLDNFKVINDSLGHEAGDCLLKAVAQRLQACLRPEDTVARLGGDEFTLLLENLDTPEEAHTMAERILADLRQPIKLPQREVFASASIGIAYCNGATQSPEILLRDADTAMYHAKAAGKAGYAVFDPSMNARIVERMEIEMGLRHALERQEFRVHYQPLIDLASGRLIGTEALVRWQHPTRGLIPPGQFIPIAEAAGLIAPMGYWVLEEACRQTKVWQETFHSEPPLTVSVNLSTQQLQQEDVVERVAAALQSTGLPPACLKIEITESGLIEDMKAAIAKLHRLKALRIKLAIDDFGTGYSSMTYLSTLPVDTIKIDQAFVSRLGECEEAVNVVSAIILLSRSLLLDVTGEGIETEAQVIQLQGLGCHVGQGYYFARPASITEMETHLKADPDAFIKAHDEAERELIETLLHELSENGRLAA